jgi:heme-degrading monooxygenase HmoA
MKTDAVHSRGAILTTSPLTVSPAGAPEQKKEQPMFIAMNRFKVLKDRTADFESVWMSRQSYLHEVPGFQGFHLLRGPEREDHVLYASHSVWASYAAFENWTRSEAFRKAHARAGDNKPTTLGHSEFEGFHAIQEVAADGTARRLG